MLSHVLVINGCYISKVKELESQLLIERKLARQHVDTKIAEQQQQMKHQEDQEQNTAPMRLPLANRPLGSHKNPNETISSTISKDQVNLKRPLLENNVSKSHMPPHPTDGFVKYMDPAEKENNPEKVEQLLLPKRTGRVSICTMERRIPAPPAPRRSSLIPLPAVPNSATLPLSLLPFPPYQADKKEDTNACEANCCLPEQTPCDSPKRTKVGGGHKKLSSILRRSVQRKIHIRKGGVNVGTEKVRVSIGSRGGRMMAHRALLGNSNTRAGTYKESQQKQIRKEKERGWNIGTVGRTVV